MNTFVHTLLLTKDQRHDQRKVKVQSYVAKNPSKHPGYVVLMQKDVEDLPLNYSIAFLVEIGPDYLLLVNENYDFFGYGSTLQEALRMLVANMKMVRDDLRSGLINERNAGPEELSRLKGLFSL